MSTSVSLNAVVVDDQSPQVAYAGQWSRSTTNGAWNNTVSFTETANSAATFKFQGNRVIVYGAVLFTEEQGPPQSAYVLDDGTPSLWIPSTEVNNTITNFFTSPLLADGEHTLTVALLTDGSPLFLDYFLYNMSQSTMASASSAPASLRPTIVTTVINAPSSAANAMQNDGSSMPVGPIVGGVIGGVAVLVSALLAVYFLYWKPTRDRAAYTYHSTSTEDWDHGDTKPLFLASDAAAHSRQSTISVASTVTPYPPTPPSTRSVSVYSTSTVEWPQPSVYAPAPAPQRQDSGVPSLSEYSVTDSEALSRGSSAAAGPSRAPLVLAGTAPLRITPRQRKAAEAGVNTPPAQLLQHSDSGYRFDAAGASGSGSGAGSGGDEGGQPPPRADHIEDLPPVYSES